MTCKVTEPEEVQIEPGTIVNYRGDLCVVNFIHEGYESCRLTGIFTGTIYESTQIKDLYALPTGTKIEITI